MPDLGETSVMVVSQAKCMPDLGETSVMVVSQAKCMPDLGETSVMVVSQAKCMPDLGETSVMVVSQAKCMPDLGETSVMECIFFPLQYDQLPEVLDECFKATRLFNLKKLSIRNIETMPDGRSICRGYSYT